MEPDPSVHFYKVPSERNSDFRIIWQCGVGVRIVTSKNYIIRQAVILLEYAKTIKDPKISAALIDKAADIRDRDDPRPDRSLRPPDVEPRFPDQT